MRILILGLALFSATAAAAEQQFDLVCKGQYRERVNGTWKPNEARFRIDLSAQAWCTEDCKEVRKIASVETGKIVLIRSDPTNRLSPSALHEIDRVTGVYKGYVSGNGTFWEEESACTSEPFSGMPTAKF